jgi:hypothetical protein
MRAFAPRRVHLMQIRSSDNGRHSRHEVMTTTPRKRRTQRAEPETVQVPAGAPPWITAELIEDTLRIWQPFYGGRLNEDDALEIILSGDRMMDVFAIGDRHEAVRRPRKGQ